VEPPLQPPGAPAAASLAVDAGLSTQLLLSYAAPVADGGSAVLSYRLEWSPAPAFAAGAGGGQLDVPCPASLAHRVLAVTSANGNSSADGLDAGSFALALSDGGGGAVLWASAALRWDAEAARAGEEELAGSHVFCEKISVDPPSSPPVPCVPQPQTQPWAPDAPGSLQSALEALPPLAAAGGAQLTVSRSPLRAAPGEFVWMVTFPTAAGMAAALAARPMRANARAMLISRDSCIHTHTFRFLMPKRASTGERRNESQHLTKLLRNV
jgi:hypothetical protein